jgi:hypothetical protein
LQILTKWTSEENNVIEALKTLLLTKDILFHKNFKKIERFQSGQTQTAAKRKFSVDATLTVIYSLRL